MSDPASIPAPVRAPCPACKSAWTMWRQRTRTFLCRKCGNVFKRVDPPAPPQ